MSSSISNSTTASSLRNRSSSLEISALTDLSSAADHGVSASVATTGTGATFIGLRGAIFLPLLTGRGGGGITRRLSSTTGATTVAVTVETETVWDFSSTVNVVFDGKPFPDAFFTGILLMLAFLAGAAFFATAFFAAFFTGDAFLIGFFFGVVFLTAFLTAFLAGAAFFAPAFFFTSFLAGLFGMSRTLCRLPLCCQFRHDAIYIQAII